MVSTMARACFFYVSQIQIRTSGSFGSLTREEVEKHEAWESVGSGSKNYLLYDASKLVQPSQSSVFPTCIMDTIESTLQRLNEISNNAYKAQGPKLDSQEMSPLLVKSIWSNADGYFYVHIKTCKIAGYQLVTGMWRKTIHSEK